MAGQRPSPPVHGDVAEQPVLDLVPLRRAGREVADRDHQPGLRREGGQLAFPHPVAVAVGSARIRGDQQAGRARVVVPATGPPPAADGLHREHRGVVIGADVHPAAVAGDVVDPVRDRLLHLRPGEEGVILHLHRLALGPPLPAGHRQPPQLLPLLGVHADHRLPAGLVLFDPLVDIAELGVPVTVLGTFKRLGIGLQAEPGPAQQPSRRRSRHRTPLPGQLGGQVPQRLGRPPQRRLRIPPLIRLNQRQQRRHQPRIQLPRALAAPAPPPGPAIRERILALLQLEDTGPDGGLAHPRHLGDGPDPAMPQQPGLRPQQQPPLPLVQMRRQHLPPQRQLAARIRRDRHTATSNPKPRTTVLFL